MSVSGLSSATLQSLMNQLSSGESNSSGSSLINALEKAVSKTSSQTASSTDTSTSSSPAYVLSSSQKQAQSQLFSYSNLGALVKKTEGSLSSLMAQTGQGVAVDGSGHTLTSAVKVDVKSLATAQSVTSGSFPSNSTDVVGTGTLNLTIGHEKTIPITINEGSLNGVAKAINDAAAGIAATVKSNPDGSYKLEITGNKTGQENRFALNGISDLVYDPVTGSGTMTASAQASDASYSVNGVSATSPSNDAVQVAPGAVTNFTQVGTQSVASPAGQGNAANIAQTLTNDFNNLINADPQGTGGSGALTQQLDQVASKTFTVNGSHHTLAEFGITVGSNGALSVDKSALSSAYAKDPATFNALIRQASEALNSSLSSHGGVADYAKSSIQTAMSQLVHMPTLASVLNGTSSQASGNSSTSSASQLLSSYSA